MSKEFDEGEAKRFLEEQEEKKRQAREVERLEVLERALQVLVKRFSGTGVAVYLVGSICRPFQFGFQSDIDIVLKGYKGDRFELWSDLEAEMGRSVEVILYENCSFQEHVDREGLRVV